jgi:flagellar biosynthesis protein FlhB
LAQDKPFEATPQRLDRARREGDLPRANEFVAVGAFAGGGLGCALAAAPLAALARAGLGAAASGDSPAWFGLACAFALLPALGAASGAVLAFVAVQGRLVVRPLRFELGRLAPQAGLRRMFSRDTAAASLRALGAGAVIAAALLPVLSDTLALVRGPASAERLASGMLAAATRIVFTALAAGALLAAFDFVSARAAWRRKLRLDHAELKSELRRSEGDPLLRGRRRRAHGALLRGSLRRLREASFVVVNPEHVAVALRYQPPDVPVPRVVLSARGEAALRVKRRAHELHVPVVEAPQLARALLSAAGEDAYVPRELYEPVARIVAALRIPAARRT